MTLTLGGLPEPLTVNLTAGGDFVCGIDSLDGDWPDGATVELLFADGTSWPATVSGASLDWDVDSSAVDEVLASIKPGTESVRLVYREDGTDLVWARGVVGVS